MVQTRLTSLFRNRKTANADADKAKNVLEDVRALLPDPVTETGRLPLPRSYENLVLVFGALETALDVQRSRGMRAATFRSLRPSVEGVAKRTFTEDMLAQIWHVFPDGIDVHLRTDTDRDSNKLVHSLSVSIKELPGSGPRSKIGRATERSALFESRLRKIVFELHDRWCRAKNITVIRHDKIRAWNVKFPLDRCPLVPRASLPRPAPITTSAAIATIVGGGPAERKAQEDRDQAVSLLTQSRPADVPSKPNTTTACIVGGEPAEPQEQENREPAVQLLNESKPANVQPKDDDSLCGAGSALLAKIRMKEAARKQQLAQLGSIEAQAHQRDLDSLPDLIVLIRSIFVTQKRPAMQFETLITSINFSSKYQMVSKASIQNRVRLLLTLLPKWCYSRAVHRITVFGIDMKQSIVDLRKQLKIAICESNRTVETNQDVDKHIVVLSDDKSKS